MSFSVCAANHSEWEENSLADYGDFSDMVDYVNQRSDESGGDGEWFYIPEELLPAMVGVDYDGRTPNERVIYHGTYGNDNSPGASHYTYAEIFDMDDEEDVIAFKERKCEWESQPEWLPCDEDEEEDTEEDEE